MPSNFFEQLGKRVASELASPSGNYPLNPASRARLGGIMRTTLDQHLNPPPGAQDSALSRVMKRGPRYGDQDPDNLGPRGSESYSVEDQDPNDDPDNGGSAPMDAATCLALIQRCIAGLTDPGEKSQLIEGLQNLLESDGQDSGLRRNNRGALDRGRRNGGRDQAVFTPSAAAARARSPAQDRALSPEVRALNSASFNKRWGALTKNIRFTPNSY